MKSSKCRYCGSPIAIEMNDLCDHCYKLKRKGTIVFTRNGWQLVGEGQSSKQDDYLYLVKETILRNTEIRFYERIREAMVRSQNLPKDLHLFPQVALSAIICKTGQPKQQHELNRVVDFLVADQHFSPLICIENNDATHRREERKKRDYFLLRACETAGIPLVTFWLSEADKQEYIIMKLEEAFFKRQAGWREANLSRIYNTNGDCIY